MWTKVYKYVKYMFKWYIELVRYLIFKKESYALSWKANKRGQLINTSLVYIFIFIVFFGGILLVLLPYVGDTISNNNAQAAVNITTTNIATIYKSLPPFGIIMGVLLILGFVYLLFGKSIKKSL